MPKTFTDLTRHALNGATMGTRWSALFHADKDVAVDALEGAMAAAVHEVDQQMSTWKPDSDLNRLSNAKPGEWVDLPAPLLTVLAAGLDIGRISGGAFDIGLGDAVSAWGFGAEPAREADILAARQRTRRPAYAVVELDPAGGRARKTAALRLDLNGIAKGYGVDRLAAVARAHGIRHALLSIDGELRAVGGQPDGSPWTVAVEAPQRGHRAPLSILELADLSVATSGDYRHWVQVGTRRLSHTMDPRLGLPLTRSPASVTVLADDCMMADAWATAMMVLGPEAGLALARTLGISVLMLAAEGEKAVGTGIFDAAAPPPP